MSKSYSKMELLRAWGIPRMGVRGVTKCDGRLCGGGKPITYRGVREASFWDTRKREKTVCSAICSARLSVDIPYDPLEMRRKIYAKTGKLQATIKGASDEGAVESRGRRGGKWARYNRPRVAGGQSHEDRLVGTGLKSKAWSVVPSWCFVLKKAAYCMSRTDRMVSKVQKSFGSVS